MDIKDMKILNFNSIAIMLILMGAVISFVSCGGKQDKIDYRMAEGYYVLNSVKNEGAYEKKINSQEEFDRLFGTAATMNAAPTPIDFSKEFAAAYIMPVTDMETTVKVDSVLWNGHKTEMYLSISTGAKQSYSLRPVKILLIDKQYDGGLTSFVTDYKTAGK